MVYRPPKHKPASSGYATARSSSVSTDPLGNPAGHPDDPEAGLPGDDRHLVAVDESYAGGDLEDRLWLFWRRQGKNVMRCILVIGVAVIVWQSWNLYQRHVLTQLQEEYQTQADKGATGLLAFADAHSTTTLGKLAVLEAADSFYKDGKFKEAVDTYAKAATIWGSDEKGQRARLGGAMALLQTGDVKGAEDQLASLEGDNSALSNFRAEAAFYNAVAYAQTGDTANVTTWIDKVNNYKDEVWSVQANALAEVVSSAKGVKVAPTATLSGMNAEIPANSPALEALQSAPATPAPAPAAQPAAALAPATKPNATRATTNPPATPAAPATGANSSAPLNLPSL